MVCERQPDSPNDPAEGRIALVRDGDWLTADGTTLGADDGVAIAAMMALVEDESLPHGPLELLMTVAEEVGLEGANALDGSLVTGSILINLDSEEDGRLTVGCAGSTDTWIRVDAPRAACDAARSTLTVDGERRARRALGRRTSQLGRANAIKVLGRALREALRDRRRSGSSRSTAARAGTRSRATRVAVVLGRARPARSDFRAAVERRPRRSATRTRRPTRASTVDRRGRGRAADAWTDDGTATLLDVVALVPTGPLAMSPDFEGLVETSTSLGEACTEGDALTLHSLSRSSNDAAMPEVIAALDAAARLAGGDARGEAQLRRLAAEPRLAGARRRAQRSTSGSSASRRS